MGTWRNILKEKKRCFVCLKAGHISKNCLSKMNCYNCSKQHHVAICHFDKIDSNTQVSENNTPSNNDSTKEETNVNFSSPSNTVLLQTVIFNVESYSGQSYSGQSYLRGIYSGESYLRGIYLRVVLNLCISPQV